MIRNSATLLLTALVVVLAVSRETVQKVEKLRQDYFSDISRTKLEYGHWYHRWGSDSDITDAEWAALPVSEQAGFTLISNEEDQNKMEQEKVFDVLKWSPPVPETQQGLAITTRPVGDSPTPAGQALFAATAAPPPAASKVVPAHDAPVPANDAPAAAAAAPAVAEAGSKSKVAQAVYDPTTGGVATSPHFSSISHLQLQYGLWYHVVGEDFDVTAEEAAQLPDSQQALLARITSEQQYSHIRELDAVLKGSEFRSNKSGSKVTLGNWYHRSGDKMDVTAAEWRLMPSEKRLKYAAVDSVDKVLAVAEEAWKREQAQPPLGTMERPLILSDSAPAPAKPVNVPPSGAVPVPQWAAKEDAASTLGTTLTTRATAAVTPDWSARHLDGVAAQEGRAAHSRKAGAVIVAAQRKREAEAAPARANKANKAGAAEVRQQRQQQAPQGLPSVQPLQVD